MVFRIDPAGHPVNVRVLIKEFIDGFDILFIQRHIVVKEQDDPRGCPPYPVNAGITGGRDPRTLWARGNPGNLNARVADAI
jgi:hypothetical protein